MQLYKMERIFTLIRSKRDILFIKFHNRPHGKKYEKLQMVGFFFFVFN